MCWTQKSSFSRDPVILDLKLQLAIFCDHFIFFEVDFNTVSLSNLSHQRDSTVPYRIVPKGYFSKKPVHLNMTFFTHRDIQRYIEKYAVTPIVTLNSNE